MPDVSAEEAYLLPPPVLVTPIAYHALETRRFQGIPSLAVTPQGRLWAIWYAGKTPCEDYNNYVVVSSSGDRGETWRERLIIDPDGEGPVRAFDSEAWLAPDGRLWLFWAQGLDNPHRIGPSGVWSMSTDSGDGEDVRWSEPRRLCDGVMMCKPLVLSTGAWALPVSFWHRRDARSAGMVVSTDGGATWQERGAVDVPPEVRNHDEHMLVERQDGSLWMLVRTKYGIGESISTDGGHTWSALTPSALQHPPARFFIRRLSSGNLLLVKHGPLYEAIGRSHLAAYLSSDDGRTWSGGLLLDERSGVSYPDGQQDRDGMIHIIYDHDRTGDRAILMARFTEEDVLARQIESEGSSLRVIVSQYPTE
ncbi:MAG: sialidase family protein [Anaerolineae bacterium]